MKCFYHNDREAAAMCQRCGKGLCTECAMKHTPCYCDECYRAIINEEHDKAVAVEEERIGRINDALAENEGEMKNYITTAILFGLLVSFMCVMPVPGFYSFTIQQMIADIPLALTGFVMGFFGRFGWKMMGELQNKWNMSVLATPYFMFMWLALKFTLSLAIGLPSFIYIWMNLHKEHTQINNCL